VIANLWPTYQLNIATARLRLRLPDDDELGDLAVLAGRGVHSVRERPFLTPWTEGTPENRARFVLREHWAKLSGWAVDDWRLGLGVFALSGQPLGIVTLRARNFSVVREVATSSWLGTSHQRQGFGTEARLGLLTLAFDLLRAESAVTEVFQDNHASKGVSRKLGYELDGISRDARGPEVLVSDRLRLSRSRWEDTPHPDVTVRGIEACRSMFER